MVRAQGWCQHAPYRNGPRAPNGGAGPDYVKGPTMAALAQLFGSPDVQVEQDDDKLLHLYWNRAELKKEYSRLRKERFELLDQLKVQEGRNARLQQKLDGLEELLADRTAANRAVVFYQIRGVWKRCHARLEKFAGQMAAQVTERERKRLLAAWATEQTALRREAAGRLDRARARRRELEAALADIEERTAALAGFWNFFRRRSVRAERGPVEAELEEVAAAADELTREYGRLQKATPPDYPGLSVQGRRLVNCMVIALAEYLYGHFSAFGFTEMARSAMERTPGSIDYGSERDCDMLLTRLSARLKALDEAETGAEFAAEVRRRTQVLSQRARYERRADTVPVPESLDAPGESADINEPDVNVLAEEFWHVTDVLLS